MRVTRPLSDAPARRRKGSSDGREKCAEPAEQARQRREARGGEALRERPPRGRHGRTVHAEGGGKLRRKLILVASVDGTLDDLITKSITAGNTAPTVTVTAPIDGGLFSFGDKLMYKVTVTDPDTEAKKV